MDMELERLMDANGGYWGKHPAYPPADWRYEVGNNETRLGYWEWVQARLEDGEE